ncbi:hypothetical protein EON65_25060 [archaeon]|nr:MAG: hypothetical protein EON65_25060 [archaeon]
MEKRQEAETCVGNLMREFRASLSEVAHLGAEHTTSSPKTAASVGATNLGTALPMTVRRLHDQVKALEDQWLDASKRARALCVDTAHRPKSVGKGGGRPGGRVLHGDSIGIFGSVPSRDMDTEESELLSSENLHALTRDLVSLSELAGKVVEMQDALQDSPGLGQLESLQYMSQSIALRLSRLAPLLPDREGDQSSSVDRLSELLSSQQNKYNQHFVQSAQRYVEDITKERQTLLRALAQQRRYLKQLVRAVQTVQASTEGQYEKLMKDVMPPCQELSTMSIAVKEICEAASRARRAKVKELSALNMSVDSSSHQSTPRLKRTPGDTNSTQSAAGGGVCSWDLLAQGRAGQEVAYLFLTLNTYLPTLTCLSRDLEKLPIEVQRAVREVHVTKTTSAMDNMRLSALDQLYRKGSDGILHATVASNFSATSPKKSPNTKETSKDVPSPSGSGNKRQAGVVKRSASASGKKIDSRPPFDLSLL